MSYREIDPQADNSQLGQGWFGIDRFLSIAGLEFLHLFGSNYPDNSQRDCWDYALNDRRARNKGMTVLSQAAVGGLYQLGLAASDLGTAFTQFAVFKRTGSGSAALISNFDQGGFCTTLGTFGSDGYSAILNGAGSNVQAKVSIPFDGFTGTAFELLILTVKGDGTGRFYVRRPPTTISGVRDITGLTAGQVYSARRLLAGNAYASFDVGDQLALVGGYSRYMEQDEILNGLHVNLRRLLGEYGGPVI